MSDRQTNGAATMLVPSIMARDSDVPALEQAMYAESLERRAGDVRNSAALGSADAIAVERFEAGSLSRFGLRPQAPQRLADAVPPVPASQGDGTQVYRRKAEPKGL